QANGHRLWPILKVFFHSLFDVAAQLFPGAGGHGQVFRRAIRLIPQRFLARHIKHYLAHYRKIHGSLLGSSRPWQNDSKHTSRSGGIGRMLLKSGGGSLWWGALSLGFSSGGDVSRELFRFDSRHAERFPLPRLGSGEMFG